METTYTILGADGLQYGPINLSQLKIWINEGRITPTTQVLRSDLNAWHPASQYTELGLVTTAIAPPVMPATGTAAATPAGATVPSVPVDPALEKQAKSGAGWFFWIAGLSLINTIVSMSGGKFQFIVGLGVSQVIDQVAQGTGSSIGSGIGLFLNLLVFGLFIFFGVFARKMHSWAFIVGMVLYGLDFLLFLWLALRFGAGFLPLAFHAYALFWIFRGFKASGELKTRISGNNVATGQVQF
jgi:GYF domain 2